MQNAASFVMYCDGCAVVECSFEISQLLNGDGEAWSGGVGLRSLNSLDHVLQQGVCGWVTVAMLNVVETEGTHVDFDDGVLDRAGQVCREVAKSEG